jgi:hypothetical protein
MEDMADGCAAPKFHLSALDPGVGKTQSVVHFARALVSAPSHRDVGILILVGRVREAEALADAIGEAMRPFLAVWTADDAINERWSGTAPENAQVVITTQQRLERAIKNQAFGSITALYFNGRPRAVRVWDEAWLPGVPITQRRDELLGLVAPLRGPSPHLADAIEDFGNAARALPHDAIIQVPDFEVIAGMSVYTLMDDLGAVFTDKQQGALRNLFAAGGATVRTWKDDTQGISLVTYTELWPDDFAPLLILDASGRVRSTYSVMAEHRDNLIRLPSAVKDYSPLNVRIWPTSGGKTALHDNNTRTKLVEGIAELVALRPGERWLVVAHIPAGGQRPMQEVLQSMLPGLKVSQEDPTADVQVITWGTHMSSNAFKEVPNVILAGTLFMRDSYNMALTHLAQGRRVETGFRPKEEVKAISLGDHAHHLLQALCRGRVRQLDGERCKKMNAYIIASKRSGIADLIPSIFPGCNISLWREDERTPGKVAEAIAYMEKLTRDGAVKLSYREIQIAIGVTSNNFAKLVTGHDIWAKALHSLGWATYGGQRARGLERL